MTQSQAELEKQAREFRGKVRDNFITGVYGTGMATHAEYDEPKIMASFAAQVREQSIAECAKAVCGNCRSGDDPERFINGDWYHTMLGFDDRTEHCSAAKIRGMK